MLSFLRRTLSRHDRLSPPHPHAVSPTETAAHAHCSESEYCFFNHAAMLPFDQIEECCCAKDRQEKTPHSHNS
ncbi:hypothetical protein EDC54_10351 [Samsonia erythrinae]|uniref:Uncharacterized protein n=1 Tax=Samsonia erythrinae TaxID=160434 RepID=A0A4R3VQ50_9GAMM|nr:hypothetical protein EDC54_10351 [Samsonia erythrinae]